MSEIRCAMTRTRQDRIADFGTFFNSASDTFAALRDSTTRAQALNRIYSLHVAPGSRAGGYNHRVVDVFFGARPIDSFTIGGTWTAVTEQGASLIFERDDNGDVTVLLYPSSSDNRRPKETCIVLKRRLDPKHLLNQKGIAAIWKDFITYMEVTCLDGAPSKAQLLRALWLRYSHPLVIDSIALPSTLVSHGKQIPKYVLTIGLSGFLFQLFSPHASNSTSEEIQRLNVKVDSLTDNKTINQALIRDLRTIIVKLDAIDANGSKINDALTRAEERGRQLDAAKRRN